MSKLMGAWMMRLKRDKVLWIFFAVMAVISILVIRDGVLLHIKYPEEEAYAVLEGSFFGGLPYIGFFSAVVISLFLGVEYSDGTIRNKLIVGHGRRDIYLSSLFTAVLLSELIALAWFLGSLTGIPFWGLWTMETKELLLYLALVLLSTAAAAAIFHLIGMMLTNRAVQAVVTILVALGLLLLGSILYNKLCEPQMTVEGVTITENGIEWGDEIKNPAYIGGTMRIICVVVLNVLPQAQEILLANCDDIELLNPVVAITGLILIFLTVSGVGMAVFSKKDLK